MTIASGCSYPAAETSRSSGTRGPTFVTWSPFSSRYPVGTEIQVCESDDTVDNTIRGFRPEPRPRRKVPRRSPLTAGESTLFRLVMPAHPQSSEFSKLPVFVPMTSQRSHQLATSRTGLFGRCPRPIRIFASSMLWWLRVVVSLLWSGRTRRPVAILVVTDPSGQAPDTVGAAPRARKRGPPEHRRAETLGRIDASTETVTPCA